MDYVGNERSPLWDDMEAIEDENARLGQSLPDLESEIDKLRATLVVAQRKTRIMSIYKMADHEHTVRFIYSFLKLIFSVLSQNALSTKAMVAKLSGFAKFDLDLKLNCE